MDLVVDSDLVPIIQQFAELPLWLALAADPHWILDLLRLCVPGLVATVGPFDRLNVKGNAGRWRALYTFLVEQEGGQAQQVTVQCTLYAPNAPLPEGLDAPAEAAFGQPGWRCWLPDQRIVLAYYQEEPALPPIAQLADPELARTILERTLREQAPGYADVQIATCAVDILSHKPGATTIFRYHLGYNISAAERPWLDQIIAKYYTKDKGENAYQGMLATWHSSLSRGDGVPMPQPLGYIPSPRAVLQSVVALDRTLEDLLRQAVRDNQPEVWAELSEYAHKAGEALAALHRSGAQHTLQTTWEATRTDLAKQIDALTLAFPDLMAGVNQLLARVEALHAATPAEAVVPSHGSFRPDHVAIHGAHVGLIDFDRFCMAESAHDLARFRVVLKLYGSDPRRHSFADRSDIEQRLGQLDAVNEVFLNAYAAQAPISRQRIALWESLYYCYNLVRSWHKIHLFDRSALIVMFQQNLRTLGIIPATG